MWLLSPSLNVLTVDWDSSDISTSAKLTIHQSNFNEKYALLRYHKVTIAFFREDGTFDTQETILQNTPQTTVFYDGS